MLEDLKVFYPNVDDKLLELYIKYASQFLKDYLNNDDFTIEYIQEHYGFVIVQMVGNAVEFKLSGNMSNVKSMTQGNRSVTFGDGSQFTITDDMVAVLPYPYIRMY